MKGSVSEFIKGLVINEGFAECAFASAEKTFYEDAFKSWIDSNKYGEMEWLAKQVDKRLNPGILLEGASSVICVLERYHKGESDPDINCHEGKIARYARGVDYHKLMKKRLYRVSDELKRNFPNDQFKVCVDTAPVLEREYASRAGLGSVGKNTLLIEPSIGSWSFLGEIITTLKIKTEKPIHFDPCSNCTRCIDACPTEAITPWSVDATKCISYLTIEHRGEIDLRYHEGIGDWIYGCDICQEVCPHNQFTKKSKDKKVQKEYQKESRSAFNLIEVIGWSEKDRREKFKKSAMKRAKLSQIRRNALIVAGNKILKNAKKSESSMLLLSEVIFNAIHDEDELVSTTAKSVWSQINTIGISKI